MPTGEIELKVDDYKIESESDILPMQVSSNDEYGEELRLKNRFLDLRREKIHNNILLRSEVIYSIRKKMIEKAFTEFQTPILTASSSKSIGITVLDLFTIIKSNKTSCLLEADGVNSNFLDTNKPLGSVTESVKYAMSTTRGSLEWTSIFLPAEAKGYSRESPDKGLISSIDSQDTKKNIEINKQI